MHQEIERKYLIKNQDWKQNIEKQYNIKQGYFTTSVNDNTIRVRIKDGVGYVTVKSGRVGFSRAEYEYEIPIEDVREMLKICRQPIISKIRHEVRGSDNMLWEIDVFQGENEGLTIAEIELESEDQTFVKPKWVGREVTLIKKYYNSKLVSAPFSKWK